MRRAGLAFALAAATVAQVSASAIVVTLRRGERVILASDSRYTGFIDGRVSSQLTACKILKAGPWWLLDAGWRFVPGPNGERIDLAERVAAAVAGEPEFAGALAGAERTFAAARPLLETGPVRDYYARDFSAGAPVAQVYIAGVDRGMPALALVGAWTETAKPFTLTAGSATCPGRLCSDDPFIAGASVEVVPMVDLILQRPRPAWVERADAAAARRLIELQVAATPATVAGPIDVLEITASGARWIDRDPLSQCSR